MGAGPENKKGGKKMEVIRKDWWIELDGAQVKVVVLRAGQESPWEGDEVVVEARIELPNEGGGELIYGFRFGERVCLGGVPLNADWGVEGKSMRWISKCFRSKKASDAFQTAEKWALGEIEKLVEARRKRRAARED